MEYNFEYICKMKQNVLCKLCNKSYAMGVMKKDKQTKLHIEDARNHLVKKQKRPIMKQKRTITKQKRPIKMPIDNAKNHRVLSSLWSFGGHKPIAFVK